jgi:hypothetical protein
MGCFQHYHFFIAIRFTCFQRIFLRIVKGVCNEKNLRCRRPVTHARRDGIGPATGPGSVRELNRQIDALPEAARGLAFVAAVMKISDHCEPGGQTGKAVKLRAGAVPGLVAAEMQRAPDPRRFESDRITIIAR